MIYASRARLLVDISSLAQFWRPLEASWFAVLKLQVRQNPSRSFNFAVSNALTLVFEGFEECGVHYAGARASCNNIDVYK